MSFFVSQIHHLVGHAHKVTCVRLFDNEKGVITGSADRSINVWDIARQTYRQRVTLTHSSTANTVDVGIDSTIAVTGHLDGGIRFWDVRSSARTADISGNNLNDVLPSLLTSVISRLHFSRQVYTKVPSHLSNSILWIALKF